MLARHALLLVALLVLGTTVVLGHDNELSAVVGGIEAKKEGSVRGVVASTTSSSRETQCALSFWLWNPTTDTVIGEMINGTSICVPIPYNIEVRPCVPPAKMIIQLKVLATDKSVKGTTETTAPYFLWGDNTKGDVYPSTKPLPAGGYLLQPIIDNKEYHFIFYQSC